MGFLDTETKNVRLDFIFTNNVDLNSAFYCEDNPNERALKGSEKIRRLREQALNYWISLALQITTTKFIAGATVHPALREVRIPNNQEGSSIAEHLATIISLV
ncbi:hypothetical protein CU098_009602, partial [Rhizopus stolonifer]